MSMYVYESVYIVFRLSVFAIESPKYLTRRGAASALCSVNFQC